MEPGWSRCVDRLRGGGGGDGHRGWRQRGGSSVLDGAGGLKTLDRSSQHEGDAEGLKDSSGSGAEELAV